MSNSKKIILAVVVVVVVVIIVGLSGWYIKNNAGVAGVSSSNSNSSSSASGALGAPTSSTRTAVPTNIVVPNAGAATAPSGVAIPAVQGAGDPAGNVSYRSFNINIQSNAFTPNTVIVNQGDTVNLELTAVDANYAFTQPDYGFNGAIPKGKTQPVQFQALQVGNFIFYCGSCGGPSKGPVGHIIVAAK